MKKVISACLYGRDPFYVEGAIINATEAKDYYPDWEFWLYINEGHIALPRFRRIPGCGDDGPGCIKLIERPVCRDHEGMAWRFMPDDDPGVGLIAYRDMDCRFSEREVSATNEWATSDKTFHLMFEGPHNGLRDFSDHQMILGGLWGMRTGKVQVWKLYQEWLRTTSYLHKTGYGADQEFLTRVIWPMAKDDVMVHCDRCAAKEDQLRNLGIEPRPYPLFSTYVVGNKMPVWDTQSYFPAPLPPAGRWLQSRSEELTDLDLIGAIYSMEQFIKMVEALGQRYHLALLAAYHDMRALEEEAERRSIVVPQLDRSKHNHWAYAQRVVKRRR